jgi:NAD-dependent dihydropyrimidine dehydrogenase PreA subunit
MSDDNGNSHPVPDDGRGRVNEQHHDWLRAAVQIGFVVFSILLGLQFRSFVHCLAAPASSPIKPRPAAVEAYLPISSLMSLTYLAKTGIANRVHPAGLVIFTLTLALALLIRRGFCSWVCPIGTAAEWAHKTGRALLGRNLSMPRWLDWILRSLKYGLLGFFLYYILLMSTAMLRQFIYGPYNRIADVKMYLFFSNISVTALGIIVVLALFSVLFKNFLCRYLCPYGALLGLFSALSPVAVRRDTNKCTGCGKCGRVCPNRIPVDKKKTIRSVECTACFDCIGACRAGGALRMGWPGAKTSLSVVTYGIMTVAAFFYAGQISRLFDYWQSDTPDRVYTTLYSRIAEIEHPRGPSSGDNIRRGTQAANDRSDHIEKEQNDATGSWPQISPQRQSSKYGGN